MLDLHSTVQNNCHISDALFAGNYTLCIYLLKMREFYRWEKQHPFYEPLSNDHIGEWLTTREALWDTLEDEDYAALEINGELFDPFETRQINAQLNTNGLVYSGGYGNLGKPVFFLAELEQMQQLDDYTLYISSRELARDLAAPPGMALDKCVFIRRESLRRFIWEKVEESHWYNDENPLARALACYDFKHQPETSLEQLTDAEVDTVLHHEIGEIKAGQILGDDWENMLLSLPRSQAELMSRAVRDHLADAISTLPMLIRDAEPARIHFYFANLDSMRKLIFPGIMRCYQDWLKSGDISGFRNIIRKAEKHWIKLAQSLIKTHTKYGNESFPYMESLVKDNYL